MFKRQGDLLFELLPDNGANQVTFRNFVNDGVIARGETTGHAHKLTENGDLLWQHGGGMAIRVLGDASGKVVHEEHDTIELEPGVWLVHRQTEYVSPDETIQVWD
jgi:hypothetical protein